MRWINSKLTGILNASSSYRCSIIAITETGIGNSSEDAEIVKIDINSVISYDRDLLDTDRTRSGGVCLVVDLNLSPVKQGNYRAPKLSSACHY